MDLTILWFILITVLFTGFFFLEGFDYGVGGLLPFLSSDEEERGEVLRTITPVWDGNEVWMITAGGALFAAFPHVYATMFSAFYLALFLMLVALILRGVAFDLRGRQESRCWKRFWDGAICFGSVVPAFLWGVAVTNLIAGLPINEKMIYMGGFFDLLTPYTIVGGLAFAATTMRSLEERLPWMLGSSQAVIQSISTDKVNQGVDGQSQWGYDETLSEAERKAKPIPGFTEGALKMQKGGRYRMVIPADKAYGNTPKSPIGPNQAVVFEVKLVSVK